MRRYLNLGLFTLLSVVSMASTVGQETTGDSAVESDPQSADRAKIETAIESYVSAFNVKDVEKLVSHWTPNGVYVSRSSGEQLSGHDVLKEEFSAILAGEHVPKLAVETESIEFISPNVAVERGSAMLSGGDWTEETTYQAVYVKREDQWLLDRVSEDVIVVPTSNYEHLKPIEFLVGDWVHQGEGMIVEIDCQFTANQNYLSRKYKVLINDVVDSSGLQIIGWDPKSEQIRSWLFDSDGGFIKGEWSHHDDEWVVQSVATLADGATGSSTSIYREVDADSFAWRKLNQVVDGKLLPNTDEVIVRRR